MLIHLLQTLAAYPTLAEGIAPPDLLHLSEQAQLDAFRVVKRRRDWLLGRWTAKHLVQRYLFETTTIRHTLPTILIAADPDGAPYAALDTQFAVHPLHPSLPTLHSRLPLSLSISHSGDRAFCALTGEEGATVGADIELIEPRETGFIAQFFTPAEIAAIRTAPAGQRDMLVTAIWSAKEAVLKALRVGLRVDTRAVECLLTSIDDDDWQTFSVQMRGDDAASSPSGGWWWVKDGYVLALAGNQHLHSAPSSIGTSSSL